MTEQQFDERGNRVARTSRRPILGGLLGGLAAVVGRHEGDATKKQHKRQRNQPRRRATPLLAEGCRDCSSATAQTALSDGHVVTCTTDALCCAPANKAECCIDCMQGTATTRCCTPGIDCASDGRGPCASPAMCSRAEAACAG